MPDLYDLRDWLIYVRESNAFLIALPSFVVLVGGLTFFPTLALGPIVEHFAVQAGIAY